MKKLIKTCLFLVAAAILFASCGHNEVETVSELKIGKGVLVLNEGTYTFASSSITFYDPDADTVMNNVYIWYLDDNKQVVRVSTMGDVAQSMWLHGEHLYIVSNNSNFIYKVDAATMKYDSKIENFYSPRYMAFLNDTKAYVSDLEGTGLWKINPKDMTHSGFIETGKPTENMLLIGNELFVTNWSNYYQSQVNNNTIQIVDTETDSLIDSIVVVKEPNSMVLDKNGHLWVMCGGGYEQSGDVNIPALFCIDPSSRTCLKRFDFESGYPLHYPMYLATNADKDAVYFIDKHLYKMSIDADELPSSPFVDAGTRTFYSVAVNPENDEVYVSDSKKNAQDGDVYRYDSEGNVISEFQAGIFPGFMLFKGN